MILLKYRPRVSAPEEPDLFGTPFTVNRESRLQIVTYYLYPANSFCPVAFGMLSSRKRGTVCALIAGVSRSPLFPPSSRKDLKEDKVLVNTVLDKCVWDDLTIPLSSSSSSSIGTKRFLLLLDDVAEAVYEGVSEPKMSSACEESPIVFAAMRRLLRTGCSSSSDSTASKFEEGVFEMPRPVVEAGTCREACAELFLVAVEDFLPVLVCVTKAPVALRVKVGNAITPESSSESALSRVRLGRGRDAAGRPVWVAA